MDLGWFELQLLFLIAQREKYGYEILNELKNSGKTKLSTGSLYPTLRRLEKKGYVNTKKCKTEDNSERVYYSISNKGESEWEDLMKYFLNILQRNKWDQLTELREMIISKANIKEGDTIVDFSAVVGELFAIELAQKVGPLGTVYLIVNNIDQIEVFEKYFSINEIKNIKPVPAGIPYKSLTNNSANSVVQFGGLHHNINPLELIIEMIRILKPNGKIVIADMQKIDHMIFNYICKMALPKHYRPGTSEKELLELFNKLELKDINIDIWHGMVIGEGIKPDIIKSIKLL